MRSIRTAVLFFTLILMATTASAQDMFPAGGQVKTLRFMNMDRLAGSEPCGQYFSFSGVPADPTKVGTVTFIYVSDNDPGRVGIPILGTDKLTVKVVRGLKAPRIKALRQGGPVYPWLEISISPEDLARAPCLKLTGPKVAKPQPQTVS